MTWPWKKILATVVGSTIMLLIGSLGTHFAGYLGPGVGVAGVRVQLVNHEANAEVHPNVPELERRLQNIEAGQASIDATVRENKTSVEGKIADLQRQQTESTSAILGAIGRLRN